MSYLDDPSPNYFEKKLWALKVRAEKCDDFTRSQLLDFCVTTVVCFTEILRLKDLSKHDFAEEHRTKAVFVLANMKDAAVRVRSQLKGRAEQSRLALMQFRIEDIEQHLMAIILYLGTSFEYCDMKSDQIRRDLLCIANAAATSIEEFRALPKVVYSPDDDR